MYMHRSSLSLELLSFVPSLVTTRYGTWHQFSGSFGPQGGFSFVALLSLFRAESFCNIWQIMYAAIQPSICMVRSQYTCAYQTPPLAELCISKIGFAAGCEDSMLRHKVSKQQFFRLKHGSSGYRPALNQGLVVADSGLHPIRRG